MSQVTIGGQVINEESLGSRGKELLAELMAEANKPKPWEGPSGDWLIFGWGEIRNSAEIRNDSIEEHQAYGHCGKTQKQAEFVRDQIKDFARKLHAMLEVNGDWKPDWGNTSHPKYVYCPTNQGISRSWSKSGPHLFYFKTEADCQLWVDMLGDKV